MENRTPQSSRHVFLLRDLGLDFAGALALTNDAANTDGL